MCSLSAEKTAESTRQFETPEIPVSDRYNLLNRTERLGKPKKIAQKYAFFTLTKTFLSD